MKKITLKKIAVLILLLVVLLVSYFFVNFFGIIFGSSINGPIRNAAMKLKSPAVCNLIFLGEWYDDYGVSASEVRYFCKAEIAGSLGDTDYCYKLDKGVKFTGTASQQYACFRNIAEKATNLSTCDKLPIESYPVSPRYECYTKIAEQESDPEICKKTPEKGYDRNYRGSRKNCLIAVGKKLNTSKFCQYLSESWVAQECIQAVENRSY